MPRQKTREELLDRIGELESENECRIKSIQSQKSSSQRRTKTTRGETDASLRCRLA